MALGIRETCLSLVFFGLISIPCASAQSWRALGPPGGDVRALALDPSHPHRVYLGTTDGHIFGSRDAGQHWERLGRAGSAPNAVVTSLIVDPRESGALYASAWFPESDGESGGVYVSRDGGWTWRESGLAGHAIRALVEAWSDPDVLVAGGLDGVFRSTDAGQSWERITPVGDIELRNFDSLAVDPHDPSVIYAGTFHLPWKTVDGGQHWFSIHEGMIDDSDVLSLALDPANPQRIFASACSGIYRSDDSGAHWKKIKGIPFSSQRTVVVRLDPSNPGTIYAGTTEGLWKTTDDGVTWRRVTPGDWVVNSLLIAPRTTDPEAGPRVLAGTEQQGVFASDEAGEHFQQANAGFDHRRILSLAVAPDHSGHIAAVLADAPNAILVTEDGGRVWSPLGAQLGEKSASRVFCSPAGWLTALSSGGLAQFDPARNAWTQFGVVEETTDQGSSSSSKRKKKSQREFGVEVNDLAFSDAGWFAATAEGLYVSRDAGLSWAALPFAPLELPATSVRVSGDGQKIRVVSSRGMIFSEDAGRTWRWHDLPFESGGALRLEFADETTALAVSRVALYISRDAGVTWQKAGAGLPAGGVLDLVVRAGIWLVSLKTGGLYVSRDEGLGWTRVKSGPDLRPFGEDGPFHALTEEQVSGLIYAGSANDGLYVLDLSQSPAVASVVAAGR